MPSYPAINRRNINPLVPKTLHVSKDTLSLIREIGAQMHVTQGSLVDTALRQLATLAPADIAELLRSHGHLTDDEYDYVMGLTAGEEPK